MNVIIDHEVHPRTAMPFRATWVIDVPWAHPLWHQYLVAVFDLIPVETSKEKPTLYRPGMTHEVHVWAIDPEQPVERWADRPDNCLLQPMNHGYQFKAVSDEVALARVATLIDAIGAGQLSPDTDWSAMWDTLFNDGVSLRHDGITREEGVTLQ